MEPLVPLFPIRCRVAHNHWIGVIHLTGSDEPMKKTFLIFSLTALCGALPLACSDGSDNGDGDGDGTGGTPGDGDGDPTTTNNGDGDGDTTSTGNGGDGGDGGDGGTTGTDTDPVDGDVCSDDTGEIASGGAGGSSSCELPEAPLSDIKLKGSYVDGYGYPHEITDTMWDSGWSQFHFSLVNNKEQYALALNAEGNGFNPCEWSRFVWTEKDGALYYCQAPYAADSECAAEEEALPDAADLLGQGCNGFPWSTLVPVP